MKVIQHAQNHSFLQPTQYRLQLALNAQMLGTQLHAGLHRWILNWNLRTDSPPHQQHRAA